MTDYAGIYVPPGQSIQRMQRAWRIYTDQHGRRFGAVADIRNNTPIAEFQPVQEKGYGIAPWYPTMRHAKFAAEGDLDFRWDYDQVAEDWSAQAASYYEDAAKLAMQLPGNVPVPEVGGEVDYRIRVMMGPPPISPAIPLACKAGDPWALGRIGAPDTLGLEIVLRQGSVAKGQEALKVINERLAKVAKDAGVQLVETLPGKVVEAEKVRSITDFDPQAPLPEVTYAAFMNEAKSRGMTHADAALAWKAHKENMAAEPVGA